MPPSGRAKKPTPKVATESSRLRLALVEGKNARPIMAAKAA
jgi:hypothetical protein